MSYFADYMAGNLSLLEAYAMAENKFFKLIHSGIYNGKEYDSLVFDRDRLARQIARASLVSDGYMVDDFNGFREWKKVDSFNGFNI